MEIQNFDYYVKLLKEFIDKDLVRIDWGRNHHGLNFSKIAKERIQTSQHPISEEEFAEIAFEIIYVCIALSNGTKQIREFEEDKINIVKEHILTNDLRDEINIKTNSSSKVIEEFNHQILTKRSTEDPEDIITHSILLEILVSEPRLAVRDDKNLENINLELSEVQIGRLIKELTQIKNGIQMIKNKEYD